MGSADKQSFEALALPHLDTVYRVARRLAHHEHDAEDLVQETFLKAYAAFDRFQVREFGIKPWLLKILTNTFLNRRQRAERGPRSTDPQTLDETQADEAYAGPPDLDYEHLDQEVKQALDQLAPEFRTVLLLWATLEFSYREIADALDVPIGTVMSRLHRARQQLARVLHDFAREQRLPGVKTQT